MTTDEIGCVQSGMAIDNPEGWYRKGGGRGFRMGNMCTPMADSRQCMAKPIQYCKVISLQFSSDEMDETGADYTE